MKKFFYVAAFVAALMFSACGNQPKTGFADAPEELQNICLEIRDEMSVMKTSTGIQVLEVDIENGNIVIEVEVDESLFGGTSFKKGLEESGINAEVLADMLSEKLFGMRVAVEKGVRRFETMRENDCAIVFRFIGSKSNDEMEVVLPPDKLPQVSMEDVQAVRAQYPGVPEEIIEVIGGFETIFSIMSEQGVTYRGIEIEGNDIVCVLELDEEMFGYDNFVTAFRNAGFDEEVLHDRLQEAMNSVSGGQQASKEFDAMRTYKFNLVMRYVGSKSKARLQARLRYDELP